MKDSNKSVAAKSHSCARKRVSELDSKVEAGLTALAQEMEEHGKDRDAPMREIFARLGDRWSLLFLLLLRLSRLRHAELRKLVTALSAEGGISQRMMTLKLRALERDGLVTRVISADTPPQVTYILSSLGDELLSHVDPLMQWVRDRGPDIHTARKAFHEAEPPRKSLRK